MEAYDTAREEYVEYCNTRCGTNLDRVKDVTISPQDDWDHFVLALQRGLSIVHFRDDIKRITREMDEWNTQITLMDINRSFRFTLS